MAITDWPAHERPRERLLQQGAQALSDAELLAIFLRVGVRGKSAVDLARELLVRFDHSLAALTQANAVDLAKLPGLGQAKAAQLCATLELARRALAENLRAVDVLESSAAVRDYLRLNLAARSREVFVALWLDMQNRLLSCDELCQGTLDETRVYPREVVKAALAHNAAAVIFAHNHPCGTHAPSSADLALTKKLKQTLQMVGVRVLDHFVVADNLPPLSFVEQGLL